VVGSQTANFENVSFILTLSPKWGCNIVALVSKPREDEHVIGYVEIDAGDIFILTYNLLPTHPFKKKLLFFWQICVCNTFINYGFQIFAPPSFSM
jgi:hypothetical protein